VERLRTRRDGGGALVRLEDGRSAVTGTALAAGPAGALRQLARRQAARAHGAAEAMWWQEVVAALRR
jgi:hypothetical protein